MEILRDNCPFCGNPPPHAVKTFRFHYWLKCNKCQSEGPIAESEDMAKQVYRNRVVLTVHRD